MAEDAPLAAVELAADIVDVTTPRALRRRLLVGLVHDIGMHAAVMWAPLPHLPHNEGLGLLDHVGVPSSVVDAVAEWPPGSLPERLLQATAARGDRVAFSHAVSPWDGHALYVVAIPAPAKQVLGVFAAGPVSDAVMRLVVALGRTYASAMARADTLRDNQRVVDAMVNELRPSDVAMPDTYTVGHLYRSATAGVAIGGDLYDWFRTDRGDLGVAVGDVSGKGVQAASSTAMAVHSLRAFAMPGASPQVAATMLNTLVASRSAQESFLTLVYARLDPGSAELGFVLAGHPPPIRLTRDDVDVLDVTADIPIGIDPDASFHLHHTTLDPGDSLVLYTDGVTEARAPQDGALLGPAGLVELLRELRTAPAQLIADGVWRGVQNHTGGHTTDDVAVVVLQRAG